jgi:hypothetical protein
MGNMALEFTNTAVPEDHSDSNVQMGTYNNISQQQKFVVLPCGLILDSAQRRYLSHSPLYHGTDTSMLRWKELDNKWVDDPDAYWTFEKSPSQYRN